MRTLQPKRMLGKVWRWLPRSGGRRVILLYHSIGDSPWSVTQGAFSEQAAWLASHADVLPLGKLLDSANSPHLQVAITFDDGYASLLDCAAPVLAAHGMTATVYVNTGLVAAHGRSPSDPARGHLPGETVMAWDDIKALAGMGWDIGSHGVGHLDLRRISPEEWGRELRESRSDIESRLSRGCDGFAYPWGFYSERLRHAVRDAGYRHAVSGVHGPLGADDDRFALRRIDVRSEYELEDFQHAILGHWDYLGLKHRIERAAAWRY